MRSILLGLACVVASATCSEAQASRLTPAMRAEIDSTARLDRMSAVRNTSPAERMRITGRIRRAERDIYAAQTRAEAHRAMLVSMCELGYVSTEYGGRDASWLIRWMERNPARSDEEWREWEEQQRRVDRLIGMGFFETTDAICNSIAPLRDTSEIRLRAKPAAARRPAGSR